MSEGTWVLLVALAVAGGFGLWRAARDGRFRGTHDVAGAGSDEDRDVDSTSILKGMDVESELGERATLLQFSSAFCAPCRVTRRVLEEVARLVPGVVHVELDAEHHLELVRRVGVTRTPTTIVLDSTGREVSRATGAPKRDEVLATLARVVA